MIITLSPSKGQDFENKAPSNSHSMPVHLAESKELIKVVKKQSSAEIMRLMSVSENIANLNYERFQSFQTPFTSQNAKQAMFAFKGDVYSGLATSTMNESNFQYAQSCLRILSGLYGCLKPLDLIQAYRLEMKTKLKTNKGENLYQFWGDKITNEVNQSIADSDSKYLLNLASNEYWKSVKPKQINAKIINVAFKEEKDGKSRIIAIFAKKARGMMADFIIRNEIKSAQGVKDFNYADYKFDKSNSTEDQFIFTRPQPKPVK